MWATHLGVGYAAQVQAELRVEVAALGRAHEVLRRAQALHGSSRVVKLLGGECRGTRTLRLPIWRAVSAEELEWGAQSSDLERGGGSLPIWIREPSLPIWSREPSPA